MRQGHIEFPRQASNSQSSCPSFLSSWGYRTVPPDLTALYCHLSLLLARLHTPSLGSVRFMSLTISFPSFLSSRLFHPARRLPQASKEWSSGLRNNPRPKVAAVGDVRLGSPTLPLRLKFSIQAHECHARGIPAELSVAEPDSLDNWRKKCAEEARPPCCGPVGLAPVASAGALIPSAGTGGPGP